MENRIEEQLINNYTRPMRKLKSLKGIVIHWTANTARGANAQANRNYFNNLKPTYLSNGRVVKVFASAHYMVDDSRIIRCVPDDEVAYHVGARAYKPIGEQIRNNSASDSPNNYLIGIEMCVNSDGDWNKTYKNTVELTRFLLDKYKLTLQQVYRHYDITGKDCPKMMIDEAPWQQFKADVAGLAPATAPQEAPFKKGIVLVDGLNVRAGNSVQFPVVNTLKKGEEVKVFDTVNSWHRIGDNVWSHSNFIQISEETKIGEVDSKELNVRKGPGTEFDVVNKLGKGERISIFETRDKWYRIGENQWAHADYVLVYNGKKGKVTYPFLNVRAGNGVEHALVGRLKKDDVVDIVKRIDKWIYIGNGQWVSGDYIQELA